MKREYVETNHGLLPLEDYLDIRAIQHGFDDYEDMKSHGFGIEKPETVKKEN